MKYFGIFAVILLSCLRLSYGQWCVNGDTCTQNCVAPDTGRANKDTCCIWKCYNAGNLIKCLNDCGNYALSTAHAISGGM